MGKALELTEAGRKFLADAPAKQKELVTAFNIALTGFTSVLEMEGKGDKQTEDHAT